MTWSQLWTILWLRWRLTRNQWSRHGRVTAAISVIVTTVLAAVGAAGGLGGFLLAAFRKVGTSPPGMLGLWDVLIGAFLLFWLIGVLSEIQRSEAIDVGKILHLPISLKGIFLVNYVASHLTLSIIVFVPWMVGLTAGFVWSRGWMMALMLPLGNRLSVLGHGLDLLAARLAGGAVGEKPPPVSRHCRRHHDGVHAAVAGPESADERPFRTPASVLRTHRASDGPRVTGGESRRVRPAAGGSAAAQGHPALVGR